jgi:hypothetical protein
MLGLRFFVCDCCETVYADPGDSPSCSNCGDGLLREISDRLRADGYFWRTDGNER